MGGCEGYIEFEVSESEKGQRLDLALVQRLPSLSRSQIRKHIINHDIVLNGRACKPGVLLTVGDRVLGKWEDRDAKPLQASPMPLEILWEDEELVVLNKPANLSVHPGAGDHGPTLVEGLLAHCGQLSSVGQEEKRPGVVHRLDKDTTGVMVFAKTDEAHSFLAAQFHDKTSEREYLSLLDGDFPGNQKTVESYLRRDPHNRLRFVSEDPGLYQEQAGWRWAKSSFRKEAVFAHRLSLVRVRLFTGRTHQIRVHSKSFSCPVLGDQLYNRSCVLPEIFSPDLRKLVAALSRQMLHGALLGFTHPGSRKKMTFEAPLPDDFAKLLGKLQPYKIT